MPDYKIAFCFGCHFKKQIPNTKVLLSKKNTISVQDFFKKTILNLYSFKSNLNS